MQTCESQKLALLPKIGGRLLLLASLLVSTTVFARAGNGGGYTGGELSGDSAPVKLSGGITVAAA
ncbi:hypothetical protein NL529_28450, partial [Klebsiella pneumoniae]|nr:hypothetical protein [Klebsiella pneumoniae]